MQAIPTGAEILELGCGAGRITHRLVELGHPVVGVDQSPEMLANVRGAETFLADIEALELGRTFPVVLLASQLLNTPDRQQRSAFLMTCRRHVQPDGIVVIQRASPGSRPRLTRMPTWSSRLTGSVGGATTQGWKDASFMARCTTSMGIESGSSPSRRRSSMMMRSRVISLLSRCASTGGLIPIASGLRQRLSESPADHPLGERLPLALILPQHPDEHRRSVRSST